MHTIWVLNRELLGVLLILLLPSGYQLTSSKGCYQASHQMLRDTLARFAFDLIPGHIYDTALAECLHGLSSSAIPDALE